MFVSFNNDNYACKPGTNSLADFGLLSIGKKFISHESFLAWKTTRVLHGENKHSSLFSSIVNDKTSFIGSMFVSSENNMHFA